MIDVIRNHLAFEYVWSTWQALKREVEGEGGGGGGGVVGWFMRIEKESKKLIFVLFLSVWLEDSDSSIINRISGRIQGMTGLSLDPAHSEPLQVSLNQ